MTLPVKYDFAPMKKGDSFFGVRFQIFDANDDPVDISGASVKMQLRKNYGVPPDLEWTTDDATIEVNTNEIFIKERGAITMDIDAYKYLYDVEVTYIDGVVLTFAQGLFTIENDVSR